MFWQRAGAMTFWLEFILGMIVLSPFILIVLSLRNQSSDLLRTQIKFHQDRQKAIKGRYDEIDRGK